jgi:hypothetical protein
MANKASFTPEEWSQIASSAMVSGMAVTASDPSGLFGLLKEGMAGGLAILEARQDPQANELVKAVSNDFATPETREAIRNRLHNEFKVNHIAEIKPKALEELRAVATLLDTKAPADAAAFKSWLRDIGQKTAQAANEGGFLGFGGVPVSEAEKATLADIATALNAPAGGASA